MHWEAVSTGQYCRLLLQDFGPYRPETILPGNPRPIVRQGTLVYMTPTVISHTVVDAARLAGSFLGDVLSGTEQPFGALGVGCACRICRTARLTILSRLVP